jgi:hypothetical protein
MWGTIILGFLAGVMGGNALPHFMRGITKERYPNSLGNGPITNLVAGWLGLAMAAALAYLAHFQRHPLEGAIAAAVGVLLIGLFHAGPGAFGKREENAA